MKCPMAFHVNSNDDASVIIRDRIREFAFANSLRGAAAMQRHRR